MQLDYWDLVHWRTLLAVAERFLEGGCSLITSLVPPVPLYTPESININIERRKRGEFGVSTSLAATCINQIQCHQSHSTLIKKKIKLSSYLRKLRMEQLQSHIWITASSYMGKYLRFDPYIRKPFLIYDFATAPLWISLYMKKIFFSFLLVYTREYLYILREEKEEDLVFQLHLRPHVSTRYSDSSILLYMLVKLLSSIYSSSNYVMLESIICK